MIRIFNHYVHRAALRNMLFDLALMLLVTVGAVAFQFGGLHQAVPAAGTHVVSFAAGLFLINSASGLYDMGQPNSGSRAVAKAVLVLVVALPLAWLVFGLLLRPTAMRWSEGLGAALMTFGALRLAGVL